MLRVAVLIAFTLVAPRAQAGVAWAKGDLSTALANATKAKKRVMVDVFATWCGPCQQMDAKVYSRPDVAGAVAKAWIPLRIDGEAGEGPELMKRYHVVGYPTVLFLEANGTEIDRVFGDVPPDEFIRNVNGFAKGEGTLAQLEANYFKTGLFDADAALELSKRASVKGDLDRARFYRDELERIAQAYAEVPHANEARLAGAVGRGGVESMTRVQLSFLKDGIQKQKDGSERGRIAAQKALRAAEFEYAKYGLLRGTKDYAAAAQAFRNILLNHAGTDEADGAQLQLAYALSGAKDTDGAKKAADTYLANHAKDKDAHAHNAYAWFCFKEGLFLDEAIEVARKGLAINAKDEGLWDTLAEVQFKAGRAADAVESAKKAAALKPADPYFKSQIKKFSGKK